MPGVKDCILFYLTSHFGCKPMNQKHVIHEFTTVIYWTVITAQVILCVATLTEPQLPLGIIYLVCLLLQKIDVIGIYLMPVHSMYIT